MLPSVAWVSTMVARPLTSTVSWRVPTFSVKSAVASWPTRRLIACFSVPNPESSTVTSYDPDGRLGT